PLKGGANERHPNPLPYPLLARNVLSSGNSQRPRLQCHVMHTNIPTPEHLRQAVNRQRLLDTARQLVAVPSRTAEGGAVADCLADLLRADGFTVERPAANHPSAPAVVVRFDSGKPGRTLQYNGHLDTVHLPFVPPAIQDGNLTGSG